jgi:hypothetical protein
MSTTSSGDPSISFGRGALFRISLLIVHTTGVVIGHFIEYSGTRNGRGLSQPKGIRELLFSYATTGKKNWSICHQPWASQESTEPVINTRLATQKATSEWEALG